MVSALCGSRFLRIVGAIVSLGICAGCSSDTSSGTATIPSATLIVIETTLVPTTIAEPTTSVAPTIAPTIAPTTTAVSELFLRAGGIGGFDFGVAPDDLIAALTAVYGGPSADFVIDYVADATYGYLRADDGSDSYVAPVRGSVCWGGPPPTAPWYYFCVHSGGATSTALLFTGWDVQCFECDPTLIPKTAAGMTAGSRASEFLTITVGSASIGPGCEHFVFGNDVEGVHLTLQSVGGSFGAFDTSGTWVPSAPSPGDIVVSYMSSDGVPIARAGDCTNHAYTFAGL